MPYQVTGLIASDSESEWHEQYIFSRSTSFQFDFAAKNIDQEFAQWPCPAALRDVRLMLPLPFASSSATAVPTRGQSRKW